MEKATKRCPRCEETKTVEAFNKCQSRKDGLQGHCKSCRKAHRATKRQDKAVYDRRYYEAHRGRILDYQKAYRAENPEAHTTYLKERAFSAVYKIECGEALYLGQTGNFPGRKLEHLSDLRLDRHANKTLQGAFNAGHSPVFHLASVNVDDLDTRRAIERSMIERLGSDCCNAQLNPANT